MKHKKNDYFRLYSYLDSDGRFDLEKYRKIQCDGAVRKESRVWAVESNIEFLSDYLTKAIKRPISFGICHGTRQGKEQKWFRKYLDCEVIGTEISEEVAKNYPHTICWDFHDIKKEWIESVDFIYSNSFDHSYDPARCINQWVRCLKSDGICIIEHSSDHEKATALDPFGVSIVALPYLILDWSEGKFCVIEIVDMPKLPTIKNPASYAKVLIIKKVRSEKNKNC